MIDQLQTLDEWRRFRSKVVPQPNGCQVWVAGKNHKGYRYFTLRGRNRRVHRISWSTWNKVSIPDGLQIDHLCRNRACINPLHLEPVTNRENTMRGYEALGYRREDSRKFNSYAAGKRA